jgi:hypothetical protein
MTVAKIMKYQGLELHSNIKGVFGSERIK